jgi:hypothetical protein
LDEFFILTPAAEILLSIVAIEDLLISFLPVKEKK